MTQSSQKSPDGAADTRRTLFELQAEMCRTMAHPVRLEIIEVLKDGERSGTELVEALDLPKANVSQHLGVLRDAGLVVIRRQGVQIFAKLGLPEIVEACMLVRKALSKHLEAKQQEGALHQSYLLASMNKGIKPSSQAHPTTQQSQRKKETTK